MARTMWSLIRATHWALWLQGSQIQVRLAPILHGCLQRGHRPHEGPLLDGQPRRAAREHRSRPWLGERRTEARRSPLKWCSRWCSDLGKWCSGGHRGSVSAGFSCRRDRFRTYDPYRVNFAGSPIFGQKAALRDPRKLVGARSGPVNRAQTVPAPGTANARPATVFFSLMGAEGTPTDGPRRGPDDRRRSLLLATSTAAAVKSRPMPRGPCVRRPRPAATSHPELPPEPREEVDASTLLASAAGAGAVPAAAWDIAPMLASTSRAPPSGTFRGTTH
jgi:hypothetical protein